MSHTFKVGDRVKAGPTFGTIKATLDEFAWVVLDVDGLPCTYRLNTLAPLCPPAPAPDAIERAIEAYIHGPRCKETATEAARAFAAAILAETDRRIAAALEPAALSDALAARCEAVGHINSAAGRRHEAKTIRAKQATNGSRS